MENKNKNQTLIIVIVVLVVLCLIATVCLAAGYFVYARYRGEITSFFETPVATEVRTPVLAATHTPVVNAPASTATQAKPTFAIPPTRTPSAEVLPLPAELAAQMDEIEAQVSEMRGVDRVSVERDLMTQSKLADVVENDFFKDYTKEDAADDTQILSVLGLVEPDFDIYNFYLKLYSEQIAGYYDLETNVMYVISEAEFKGPERQTYAHEYNHALQNQRFNPRETMGYSEEECKDQSEYCAAVQSLIEGDSTLLDYFWLDQYGTDADKKEIEESYNNTYPEFEAAPEFFKADFSFPYAQGTDFAYELYKRGGFEYIDEAFSNPPVSTEQIMHFKKYPNDVPVKVTLPDLNDSTHSSLEQIDSGVMGEWYTYLILGKGISPSFRLDDEAALKAAEGWGGDAYAIYRDKTSNRTAMVLKTVWDSTPDAQEFYEAMVKYNDLRWAGAQRSADGDFITWVNADGTYSTLNIRGYETLWFIGTDYEHPVETDGILLQSAGGAN